MVSWMDHRAYAPLYRTRIELGRVVRCQSAAPAALYVRQCFFTELRIFGGDGDFLGGGRPAKQLELFKLWSAV